MTWSHRSLLYAPSSNSILSSSVSTETIPLHNTGNNSSTCVASHEGESVEMIPEFAARSYTMDCGDPQRIQIRHLFDRKISPSAIDNSIVGNHRRKTKESPLQSSSEISEMEMQLKNLDVFSTPKSMMNKKKSLSASWLAEGKKG
ncbi:unnamed protein product [Onchocerca flexuosa]|uniref:Uncharacterized protein n=1 Tax=Onchocerca flexuosa TaxID=387005 RepID=A0A183HLX0_9BILA|nr:unnamed protein product [Onchocerca flexuosa]